ncbi:MAG: hypothetical protein K8S23_01465 [Candidatus Cloacimonetes bacterium]|nr:hypothetical protein [Candidatus Cloacimonadota bacterium]
MLKKIVAILILSLFGSKLFCISSSQKYDYNLYFKENNRYGSLKYFSGEEFYNSIYINDLEGVGFKIERVTENIYMFNFFYKLKNINDVSPFYYYREIDMLPYNVLVKLTNIRQFKTLGFLTNDTQLISELLNSPIEMIKLFLNDENLFDDVDNNEIAKSSIKLFLCNLRNINQPSIFFGKRYLTDYFINIVNVYDESELALFETRINIKERYISKDDIIDKIYLVNQIKTDFEAEQKEEQKELKTENYEKLKAEREKQENYEELEADKREKERLFEIEKERKEKVKQANIEAEKQEKLLFEKLRIEKEEREKKAKIKAEKEKQAKLRAEEEKKKRLAKIEEEKKEKERLLEIAKKQKQEEKTEKQKLEKLKAENEEQERLTKIEAEKKEKVRKLEEERKEKLRLEKLKTKKEEKLKAEREEKLRLETLKAEKERRERKEQIKAEKRKKERLAEIEKERKLKEEQAKIEAKKQEELYLEKLKAEKEKQKLLEIEKLKQKKKIKLSIIPKKENFEKINVTTVQFEYFIESNFSNNLQIRDFLDISNAKITKEIDVNSDSELELGFHPPKGFSINDILFGNYYSVQLQPKKQNIKLSIKKLDKIPIIFIDKSEIAPIEWVGVEPIIKHIKKQIKIKDKYGIFYVSGEKLFGKFYTMDDRDFEDFIWDTIYMLPTSSGVRLENILPIGEKWLKSDWNQQYFPEIHLFLSQATLKSISSKNNVDIITNDFNKDISKNLKEKNVSMIYHIQKNKQNPINLERMKINYKWIK